HAQAGVRSTSAATSPARSARRSETPAVRHTATGRLIAGLDQLSDSTDLLCDTPASRRSEALRSGFVKRNNSKSDAARRDAGSDLTGPFAAPRPSLLRSRFKGPQQAMCLVVGAGREPEAGRVGGRQARPEGQPPEPLNGDRVTTRVRQLPQE